MILVHEHGLELRRRLIAPPVRSNGVSRPESRKRAARRFASGGGVEISHDRNHEVFPGEHRLVRLAQIGKLNLGERYRVAIEGVPVRRTLEQSIPKLSVGVVEGPVSDAPRALDKVFADLGHFASREGRARDHVTKNIPRLGKVA